MGFVRNCKTWNCLENDQGLDMGQELVMELRSPETEKNGHLTHLTVYKVYVSGCHAVEFIYQFGKLTAVLLNWFLNLLPLLNEHCELSIVF